jgi:hypothetical protein
VPSKPKQPSLRSCHWRSLVPYALRTARVRISSRYGCCNPDSRHGAVPAGKAGLGSSRGNDPSWATNGEEPDIAEATRQLHVALNRENWLKR